MKIRNRKEAAKKAAETNRVKHGADYHQRIAKEAWQDPERRQTGGFYGRSEKARIAAKKRWEKPRMQCA